MSLSLKSEMSHEWDWEARAEVRVDWDTVADRWGQAEAWGWATVARHSTVPGGNTTTPLCLQSLTLPVCPRESGAGRWECRTYDMTYCRKNFSNLHVEFRHSYRFILYYCTLPLHTAQSGLPMLSSCWSLALLRRCCALVPACVQSRVLLHLLLFVSCISLWWVWYCRHSYGT